MSTHSTSSDSTPTRMLRRPAVLDRVGVSYSTIWRLERAGKFPKSIQISPGAVAWIESDIEAWLASRIQAAGR